MMADTVVCIASGPSLTDDQCLEVKRSGHPTIAVNNSWMMAGFARILYAGDLAWWDMYHGYCSFTGERWTNSPRAADKYGLKLHKVYGAHSSGQRAIELAIQQGAKRVILIGYDCHVNGGAHWHPDHAGKNPDAARCAKWLQQYRSLQTKGAEIINCTPGSALTQFRRGDLCSTL